MATTLETEESVLDKLNNSTTERNEMKPTLIAIHKKKFLIALKETPHEIISEEEEEFIRSYKAKDLFRGLDLLLDEPSACWTDSTATKQVNRILKRNSNFDIAKYLQCVKDVFLVYSGKIDGSKDVITSMEYILAHARQFGNPDMPIFNIEENANGKKQPTEPNATPLPRSKYYNQINKLIDDLKTKDDETKYQTLNVNTTYVTLLMLRRIVKDEAKFLNTFKNNAIHKHYLELCPFPLDTELPNCNFKSYGRSLLNNAYLAVNAYLKTTDGLTKIVLETTSINYLKWTGLHLPKLFLRVAELYDMNAGELFDFLLSDQRIYDEISYSLINLADDYYKMWKLGTFIWFPYCRVFDSDYHLELVGKRSTHVCIVLAVLVDLKLGFDKSNARNAHWTNTNIRGVCTHTAKELHKKYLRGASNLN